ncbi:hypothetical protein [Anabaena subtropica]|uniref:Uncharacterized protein n=1 Tax=Anabaena subtropica FACHB-260 TaxID=2692884 RepID=A0ABR8CKJ1_9NOST|nr:hypothetical protein [Anabaena subtropica]MBD2343358.1 hypothetical protein [Anabaena subtropica FACHB-260]
MKRTIWYFLISALLIEIPGQAMPPASLQNAQGFPRQLQNELASPQLLSRSNNTNLVDIAQAAKEIDEKTAFNLVWNLPQVQRKVRTIQRLSKGTIKVAAIVDGFPVTDDPYYKVRVYEDQPDHNTTIYWFRVSNTTGVIEALDVIENRYISLEEWREQLRRRR